MNPKPQPEGHAEKMEQTSSPDRGSVLEDAETIREIEEQVEQEAEDAAENAERFEH